MNLESLARRAGLEHKLLMLEASVGYPLLDLAHPRFQEAYALLSCLWAQWIACWDCRLVLIESQVHLILILPVEHTASASLFDELRIVEELLS